MHSLSSRKSERSERMSGSTVHAPEAHHEAEMEDPDIRYAHAG
jgi:hypothetical protein